MNRYRFFNVSVAFEAKMSKIKDATVNSSTQCKCSVRIKRKLTGSIVFHLSKRANYVPYGYLGPGTVFTGQNTLIFAASIPEMTCCARAHANREIFRQLPSLL